MPRVSVPIPFQTSQGALVSPDLGPQAFTFTPQLIQTICIILDILFACLCNPEIPDQRLSLGQQLSLSLHQNVLPVVFVVGMYPCFVECLPQRGVTQHVETEQTVGILHRR